jgi:hypothetical protein
MNPGDVGMWSLEPTAPRDIAIGESLGRPAAG